MQATGYTYINNTQVTFKNKTVALAVHDWEFN